MSEPVRVAELPCDEVRETAGAFVLGALEPADDAAIRAHLATCDDPHAEIAELGSVLPVLDASVPQISPSADLKSRIMAAATADLAERRDAAPAATPIPFPTAEERIARATRAGTSSRSWALRIAAVLGLVVLGGWNVLLQGQLGSARSYEQNVAQVLQVAGKTGSVTAILTAKDGVGPAGLAAVAADGTVSIAMRDLAPTTGNQVYTAWVIGPDKVPKAIGGFTVGSAGTAYFTAPGLPPTPGNTLALTLEPAPGATAPAGPVVSAGATAG